MSEAEVMRAVAEQVRLAEHKLDQYLNGERQIIRLGIALEACRKALLIIEKDAFR